MSDDTITTSPSTLPVTTISLRQAIKTIADNENDDGTLATWIAMMKGRSVKPEPVDLTNGGEERKRLKRRDPFQMDRNRMRPDVNLILKAESFKYTEDQLLQKLYDMNSSCLGPNKDKNKKVLHNLLSKYYRMNAHDTWGINS